MEAREFSYIFCSCELMTYMSSRDTRKLLAKILIIIDLPGLLFVAIFRRCVPSLFVNWLTFLWNKKLLSSD